jgi:hypothetical protein
MKKSSILKTLIIALSIVFVSSCSKEQLALNKLEGTWRYTKISTFGVSLDMGQLGYANGTLQFSKCSAKDNLCSGVINLTGQAIPFQYDMAKDGKSVTVTNANGSTIYNIKKLDKKDLVYTTKYDTVINNVPVSADLEFTLVKQ